MKRGSNEGKQAIVFSVFYGKLAGFQTCNMYGNTYSYHLKPDQIIVLQCNLTLYTKLKI
jgi:hypothetical protein